MSKQCCKCKEQKTANEFSKNKSKGDGLNSMCKECMTLYRKKYNSSAKNKARHAELERSRRNGCVEKQEAQRAACRKWHAENRDERLARQREYYQENVYAMRERASVGRDARALRVPSWLTEDHRFSIREVYIASEMRSEMTGVKHHVDHIIPLQGKTVSGLHVPWNLQVITAQENLSKSNGFKEAA